MSMHSIYRPIDAAILVCSVDNRHSLQSVSKWAQQCRDSLSGDAACHLVWVLVANKCDLRRQVDTKCLSDACTELGIQMSSSFFHVSAKTGMNVKKFFMSTLHLIHHYKRTNSLYVNQSIAVDEDNDLGNVEVKQICKC